MEGSTWTNSNHGRYGAITLWFGAFFVTREQNSPTFDNARFFNLLSDPYGIHGALAMRYYKLFPFYKLFGWFLQRKEDWKIDTWLKVFHICFPQDKTQWKKHLSNAFGGPLSWLSLYFMLPRIWQAIGVSLTLFSLTNRPLYNF